MASKKERRKNLEVSTEREVRFLTPEEVKAKELKYFNKVKELKKCLKFVEDAKLEADQFKEQQVLQDKWQNFLSCNPLPKPYLPPDIRLFYAKLKYWERENVDNSLSWLLFVDERSILSQNIFRQDITHNTLKVTLKKDIGREYDKYINDSLNILRRLEYFLDDQAEVAKCSPRILDDILTRKTAVQQEIVDFLDRFTYRIISSENAEMNSVDGLTAVYFFKALDFDIHIWCLKDVAVRFSHLSEPHLTANFSSINLELQIPVGMLKENLVVRALHMKFDHFSEKAKSYRTEVLPRAENSNLETVIIDLPNTLLNEWSLQKDMQYNKLNELKQKYLEYEILKQQYTEQIEKQKLRSKEAEKSGKKPTFKMPKEPVHVEDGMVPDIFEDFLEEEQKQYVNIAKNPFKPELLNLSSDEINLREYMILGGTYQVYYIQKPLHTDFSSFNMTWHKNESKLQIERNIQIKLDSGKMNASKTHMSVFRSSSQTEMNKRSSQPNENSPWFVLTFELPEYLCYWSEPTACLFEETTSTLKQSRPIEAIQFKGNMSKSEPISLPSLSQNTQPLDSEDSLQTSMKSVQINDFSLLGVLTTSQIRHIERHILPRIISSYKFPKEVQQEDSELANDKPKDRRRRLLRQKAHEVAPPVSNKQFTFSDRQNNPERIYTIHTKVEKIHILKELNVLRQEEPETFAQLLQIIKDIKKKYKSNINKILDLKPLTQKIVTQNKRIRQMLRQQEAKKPSKAVSIVASLETKVSAYKPTEDRDTQLRSPKSRVKEIKGNIQQLEKGIKKDSETGDLDSATLNYKQNVEELEDIKYSHWTTIHILESQFDCKTRRLVIHTDRLGNFGFAFKRYEHFPFKYWALKPHVNDPDNEVVFTLDTQHVRCLLYITADGIRGHVTEPTEAYDHTPKIYLEIKNPVKDFKELKQRFRERHFNIFAENDARFYIKNGYFSEKHLPSELHTYNCMSVHSTQMSFNYSLWNRIAARRDIMFKFKQYQDPEETLVEVRVTPGEAYFVEVQELCSEDLNNIKLDYNLTWRNIESYSDLHHLIVSMYPAATDLRCKNSKLICFVRDLLNEIRPLSFS